MFQKQERHKWKTMFRYVVVGSVFISITLLYCLSKLLANIDPPELPLPHSCAPQPDQDASNSQQNKNICVPKVDIMFLKTHKTGSSTLLNILFRFGEKNKLKFAFPSSRNDFLYPSPFHHMYVHDYTPGMCYNIMCNHMRFNAPEVSKVLPKDTFYITILRDPAELFESAFHYYGPTVPLIMKMPGKNKMSEFLRDPDRYFIPDGFNSFYLKNLLFFDFGWDSTLDPDDPHVEESIRLIAEQFHLVMLMEYFEESLILFKDTLCWDDLLFFKLNFRKESTVSSLTPELRRKALEWNAIDWKLYMHFNFTFWKKVESYGRKRMEMDVAELRRRNAHMVDICIKGGHAVEAERIDDAALQPWQPSKEKSIMGYNLKDNINKSYYQICQRMITPEIQYLSDLGVNLWLTKLWGLLKNILNL
ncbi:galactosylceramide sulfotransferase-like [Mugil cephalus]|uniref:galactosylceramide sulfotransferase-like n=1 Tax=Mugil cephalus TaxID=48193 RepID=UPI001FB69F54|nr:galactosylceramide sulfotransferase-like [Mugil cephalus]